VDARDKPGHDELRCKSLALPAAFLSQPLELSTVQPQISKSRENDFENVALRCSAA
jgi:hypothetical protein